MNVVTMWAGPLPPAAPEPPFRLTLHEAVEGFEESFVMNALRRNGWNLRAASRELRVGYSTLKARVARYRNATRAALN